MFVACCLFYASPEPIAFLRVLQGGASGLTASGTLSVLAFGALMALASVTGDLSASLLKRCAEVKDSGAVVPGYGGVIDVIDSLVAAGPVAYIFLKVCMAGS
jgi:CDP-diglyceride synthetase